MTRLALIACVLPAMLVSTLTVGPTAQGGQSAAAASTQPPTGMIVGQVVDDGSGAPVPEAIVTLARRSVPADPAAPLVRVMADSEGRFFFAGLAAGDYYLGADKEGHAPGAYGRRLAWGQSALLSLADGERLTGVTLRTWKYGVIAGTVVDEAGEPVVGVTVRALMKELMAGGASYGNLEVVPQRMPAATTDDRGMFRVSQLSPGTYVVLVPSPQTTVPASAIDGPNTALRSELFFAGVAEMSLLGQPRTQQIGGSALLTLNRVAIPPPPSDSGRMTVYPTTYYPAAATAAAASPIAIESGEERTDIAIAIRPVPAVRVSGRLVTPDGSVPPPTTLRLTGPSTAGVITRFITVDPEYVGLEAAVAVSDANGRFTFLGVPPGEYVLTHGTAFLARAAQQGQPAYWISQTVSVGSDDVPDLTVPLRAVLRVEGRVEYRAGSTPVSPRTSIQLDTPFGEPANTFIEAVKAQTTTFSGVAAGGRYIVRPAEFAGWFVESITLGGKDITDRVFDLQTDVTSIVVTYTDRPQKITGLVTGEQGGPDPDAAVLVFPVDPRQWSGYGSTPRTLRSALTTRHGVFTIDHLPRGDYYAVAVDTGHLDGWTDPARLELLATQAERVSVAADGSPRTIDLRTRTVR